MLYRGSQVTKGFLITGMYGVLAWYIQADPDLRRQISDYDFDQSVDLDLSQTK